MDPLRISVGVCRATPTNQPRTTSKGSTMTAALNITARQLKALVAPVLPLAGTDDMLPVLRAVHIEANGPWLIASATDRFRLGVHRLRCPDGDWPAGWSALVPTRTLRGILAAFRPSRKDSDPELKLTISDDALHVASSAALLDILGADITYPLETGEFPKLRSIIREALAAEPDAAAFSGYNWRFLADFAAAGTNSSGTLSMRINSATNPASITDGEYIIGILMPRRLITGAGTPTFPKLEDWSDILAPPNKPTAKKAAAKKPAAKKAPAKKAAMAGAR